MESARTRGTRVRRVVEGDSALPVQSSATPSEQGEQPSAGADPARPPSAEQFFIAETLTELDDYYVTLKTFGSVPPDEVFQRLSAISARLCELRGRCWDFDTRRTNSLRSRRIDPLIEEVDRQFRFHSRIQATRQFEADLMKGA